MQRTVLLIIMALCTAFPASGETFKYTSDSRRDPFIPLIGQVKAPVTKLEEITSPEDLRLEGVVVNAKGQRVAALNGELLKVKDKVGEVEIKKITANSVTLLLGGTEHTLKLFEQGGDNRE